MSDSSDSPTSIIHTLNPTKLIYFFDKNKLTLTLLITVLSFRIGEFVLDIYEHIFLPVINHGFGGKPLGEKCVDIFGINIKIGKVCLSFIRLIIIMYVMYLLALLLQKISKKSK